MGGYYFEFSMMLSVIDSMIKTEDRNLQMNAKKYLKEIWKSYMGIKFNLDIPVMDYIKKTIKLVYISVFLFFR